MDHEWSEMNRDMQQLIRKQGTFKEGIRALLALRNSIFEQITQIVSAYPAAAFSLMPFPDAQGYHSKTLAYSIWHIFRIEDIVAHELITGDTQIFFRDNWQHKIGADIITTGNELAGEKIVRFSDSLNVSMLYQYVKAVKESTEQLLQTISFADSRQKISQTARQRLLASECVSSDEAAAWLVDYWCGKDIGGLIRMPFSRHWIMHTEAMRRIKNQLCKEARRGVDPVAYCGFSCNHCFLAQWCGSCRTEYNTCSFATCAPDGVCPNVSCCNQQGYDGCWECAQLKECRKGFYTSENDGAAVAKAHAMYVGKYGKKAFLKMVERFHKNHQFEKSQEVLGQDVDEAFRILEEQ